MTPFVQIDVNDDLGVGNVPVDVDDALDVDGVLDEGGGGDLDLVLTQQRPQL